MTKSLMNQCGVETTVFKAKDPQSGTAQLPTKALHAKAPLANVLQRLLARWHQRRAQRQAIRQTAWQSSPIAQQRFGLDWFSGTGFFGKTLNPLVAALSAAAGGGLAIQAHAQTITNVAPNGRTATNVQTSGSVLNVTTNTLAGTNAFNSFSRFDIGQQSTVNLVLPNGATHLINMVYDAPIRIDGVLNSIKGNQIGGNIVFADPYGMIVGSRGVLNVGSLTAIAPTRSFMDGVLDANGVINPLALTEMLNGRAARSADGSIRIDGRINALERVRLEAAQVTVNGTILASAEAAHQEAFVRAVNVNGLQQATGMVEKGGVIEIVGAAITVGGTLDVSGKTAGGTISIGRVEGADKSDTLSVTSSANLKADATESGDGGVINLWGTNGNTFAGTASAKGGANGGNGGFVEVSGEKNVIVSGVVDTSAASGKIGTFVIDPSDICIVLTAGAACSGGSTTLVSTLQDSTSNIQVVASSVSGATVFVGDSGGGATVVDLTTKSNGTTSVNRSGKTVTFQGDSVVFNAGSTLKSAGAGVIVKAVSVLPLGTISMGTGSAIISGGGDVSLSTDSAFTGGGSIGLTGATISSGGGQVILKAQDVKLPNPVNVGDSFTVSRSGISLAANTVINAGVGTGVTLTAGSNGVSIGNSTLTTSGAASAIAISTTNELFLVASDPLDTFFTATFVSRGGGVSISNSTLASGAAGTTIAAGTAGLTVSASTLSTAGGPLSLSTSGFVGPLSKAIIPVGSGDIGASIAVSGGSVLASNGGSISLTAVQASSGIAIGSASVLSSGGSIEITAADGDVTLNSGALVSSRNMASNATASDHESATVVLGTSGDININAQNITVGAGAGVYAQGGKTVGNALMTGGAVSIAAQQIATPYFDLLAGTFDLLDAESSVTISGKVKGDSVSISANASGVAQESEDPDSGFKMMVAKAVDKLKSYLPGDAAAMISKANATVTINSGAVIVADGEVSIKSLATQVSKIELEYGGNDASPGNSAFAAGVTFGMVEGSSNLTVKSGASITSGDKLTLLSRNSATLENSTTIDVDGTAAGLTLAISRADTQANALVESGAIIAASAVDFAAQHMGSYNTEAVSQVKGSGKAGGAIALAFLDASATAQFGADLSGVGNVTIEASNLISTNRLKASTQVGDSAVDAFKNKLMKNKLVAKISAANDAATAYSTGQLGDFLQDAGNKDGDTAPAPVPAPPAATPSPTPAPGSPAPAPATAPANSATTPLKLGSAVAMNLSNFSSDASISAGTKINSTGTVSVVSLTENNNVHNITTASAPSAPKGAASEDAPDANVAIALAVGVGIYNQSATSTINSNVEITAGKIGVHSETSQPLTISWLDWKPVTSPVASSSGASDVKASVTDFLADKKNGTLGAEEQVLSSYANATAQTGQDGALSLAGAVNWFDVSNTARSYVASGAKLNATSTDSTPFTVNLHQEQAVDTSGNPLFAAPPAGSPPGAQGAPILEDARAISFAQSLSVQSKNLVESANVGGNFAILLQGTGGGKGGAGGAFNYSAVRANTMALVDDGATLTSASGVSVNALSEDKVFSVAPTSGRGATMGGNAIAGYTTVDNHTIAAVSKRATVDAAALSVQGNEDYQVWTVGGAFNLSKSAGVGVAVGVNTITTDTQGFIGEVAGLRPSGAAGQLAATGSVTTENLTVTADTTGQLGALAVAAAVAWSSPPPPAAPATPAPPGAPAPTPTPAPPAADPPVTSNDDSKADGGGDIAYWIIDQVRLRAIQKLTDNERIQTALTAITDPKVISAATDSITSRKTAASTDDAAAEPAKPAASPVVAPAPASGTPPPPPPPPPSSSQQGLSFAGAGSLTVNITKVSSVALVDGATVKAHAPTTNAVDTTVRAINQTNMYSGSGGAALAKAGGGGNSVGIAGAIGVNLESNTTSAAITNSTITNADDTSVRAVSVGQHIAAGVGLAVASGSTSSFAGAGSGSVIVTSNATTADIADSVVTGRAGGTARDVNVTAIDAIDMGAGGIAIAGSSGSALGITATVLLANNTTRAQIAGGTMSGVDTVTVAAFDPSRLIAAGLSAAISTSSSGVAASGTGVVTAITNTTTAAITKSSTANANVQSTGLTRVVSSDSPQAEGFTTADLTAGSDTSAAYAATKDANFDADIAQITSGASAKDDNGNTIKATTPQGSMQIAAALGVSASANASAGISLVGNGIGNQHSAVIDGATLTAGSVSAKASDNSLIVGVAVGVAATSGKFAGMGSATANVNTSGTTARIGAASGGANLGTVINTTGLQTADAVSVQATSNSQIWTLAGNVAVAGGSAAAGAAITYNQNSATTNASIRNATINAGNTLAGNVKLQAVNAAQINSAAIAASASSSFALAGSFSWNWIALGAGSHAFIDKSSVTAHDVALTVGDPGGSGSQSTIRSLAGAFAGSGSTAIGLGIAVNDISVDRQAVIEDGTINASGTVNATATDNSSIYTAAASIAASSSAAVGASLAVNVITNDTRAQIGSIRTSSDSGQVGTSVTSTGDLGLSAVSSGSIYGAVINANASGSAAVGASIAVNVIASKTTAELGASDPATGAAGQTRISADKISLNSSATNTIYAGIVSANASGTAAVGGVFAANVLTAQTVARIGGDNPVAATGTNASVSAQGDVSLSASNSSTIGVGLLSLNLAGTAAVGGAFGTNLISNVTTAEITRSSLSATGDDVSVTASDTSTINNAMIAINGSGTAAVGGAFGVNRVGNSVNARIWGDAAQSSALVADSVVVSAVSRSSIRNAAAGVAASGTAGVAGTAVVNLISTNVDAEIDRNADVLAANNVGVLANDGDSIYNAAGSVGIGIAGAGVGVTAAVNIITGSTSASIGGNDSNGKRSKVDALGNSAAALTVSDGLLGSSPALKQDPFAAGAPAFSAPTLATGSRNVRGVAVNALAVRSIASGAASVGGGFYAGVAATVGVSAIAGDTTASVSGADINQRQLGSGASASSAQDVDVQASSNTYAFGFTGSVGVGAFAGVGVAADSQGFGVNTRATVSNSKVKANNDVNVRALASEASSQLDVGVGGALVGVQGTGSIAIFRGATEARLYGGQTTASDVLVDADHQAGFGIVSGAAAGGLVGAAGAFNVGVNLHSVVAQIGDDSAGTNTTSLSVSGATNVDADSRTTINQWTAVGAAGGATMTMAVSVGVLSDSATAKITHTALQGGSVVNVDATVDSSIVQRSGAVGFSAGGGSFSGAVGIALARGQANASIENSDVSGSLIDIEALNRQNQDSIGIGGGVSTTAAGVGTFQLNMVGLGSAGSDTGRLGGSNGYFSKASDFGNNDRLGGTQTDSSSGSKPVQETSNGSQDSISSAERAQLNSANKYDFSTALNATNANITSAKVVNSTLRAGDGVGNGVTVQAISETSIRNVAGAGAVGLAAAGVGLGLGLSFVYNGVNASIDSNSNLVSLSGAQAPNVAVNAVARDEGGTWDLGESKKTVSSRTFAGAVGGFAGVSASIGQVAVDNNVSASFVGGGSNTFDNVAVTASDTSSASSNVYGIAASAGGAVGLASSTVQRTGTVAASAKLGTASSSAQATASSLAVLASEAGTLAANTFAGSAGLGLAVQGNGAGVVDNRTVNAQLSSDSNVLLVGDSVIQSVRSPAIGSQVWGVALSGVAGLGISVGTATLAGSSGAFIGAGSRIAGTGGLTVYAANDRPTGGGENATSFALAGAGGLFVGAAGAGASVLDSSSVSAVADDNLVLAGIGDLDVSANNGFSSVAFGAGAAIGFVGVGAVGATASATGSTLARVGANLSTSVARLGDAQAGTGGASLFVTTGGERRTRAYALAGAGGIVAGAAAVATANQSGDSIARIGAANVGAAGPASPLAIYGNQIVVNAAPTLMVGASSAAYQVSFLGASASVSRATVSSTAQAQLGPKTILSAQDISINSSQTTNSSSPSIGLPTPSDGIVTLTGGSLFNENAGGTGGGVLAFSGADSLLSITTGAFTSIGAGSALYLLGDPTSLTRTSRLRIGAGNTSVTSNATNIDTGGAVAVPFANSSTNLTENTLIDVGDGTTMYSDGLIEIGTYGIANVTTRTSVNVYGLASLGDSRANSNVTSNQTIAVGAGSSLFSWGDTRIMTGKGADLTYSNTFTTAASADAFTGLIGTSGQGATANSTVNAAVLIGGRSATTMNGVRASLVSNRNIVLGSDDGTLTATATGSSQNLLEKLFSSSSSHNSSVGVGNSSLAINANMTAGARNSQSVQIDANGNVTAAPSDVVITHVSAGDANAFNPTADLQNQISNLQAQQLVSYSPDVDIQIQQLQAVLQYSGYPNAGVNTDQIGVTASGPSINNGAPSGAKYHLWASGGNISMQSRSLSGQGALTANGGANISVNSASSNYMFIGDMTIPDLGVAGGTGGNVTVLGGATLPGGFSKNEVNKNAVPVISVINNYAQVGSEDPGSIYVSGSVNNLSGLFELKKSYGNITMTGGYNAQTVNVEAPNGTLFLNYGNILQSLGGNPEALWKNAEYLPASGDVLASIAAQLVLRDYYGYSGAAANAAYGQTMTNIGLPTSQYDVAGHDADAYAWWGWNGDGSSVLANRGNQSFLGGNNQVNWSSYNAYKALRAPYLNSDNGLGRVDSLSNSNANQSGGIVAGQLAVIRAAQLNVNAPIRAGRPSGFSVSINNNPITVSTQVPSFKIFGVQFYQTVLTTIHPVDCLQDAACRPTIADRGVDGLWRIKGGYDPSSRSYTGLRALMFPVLNAGDAPVSVAYDATSNQFVTDGVQGGGGGMVWLAGQISSTRQSNIGGSISVNAGVSNVSINNTSGVALTTGDISPGSGSTGVIRITDNNFRDASYNPLSTFYVYQPGQSVTRYQSYTAKDWTQAGAGTQDAAAVASYQPLVGQRYSWDRSVTVSRSVSGDPSGGDFAYTSYTLGKWNVTSAWTGDTNVTRRLYVNASDTSDFHETFALNSVTNLYDYRNYCYGLSTCTTRYWNIPNSFTLTSTSSVRADYAIGISFGGSASGLVTISSPIGLRIGGNINNIYGTTSLSTSTGDLTTAAGVTVQGRSLALTASGGGISGSGSGAGYSGAFDAVMGDSGSLQVAAGNSINLRLAGSSTTLSGNGIRSASGDITVSSSLSIFGQSNPAVNQLVGNNINLRSDAGGFGTAAAPLRMWAKNNVSNGVPQSGVVNAIAFNGVYLDQQNDDFRVGTISSYSGDVWLKTPGSISAVPNSQVGQRTDAQLAALWDNLGLTGAAALNKATSRSVNPYVAGVNASYSEWWTLRSLGVYTPGSGSAAGTIVLSQDGLDGLRARASVATGKALPTNDDIQNFANSRLGDIETGFANAIDANWRAQAQFATQDSSWRFVASTTQSGSLTAGAVWDPNALGNSINASALQSASSGGVQFAPSAISGGYVTMIAGQDIGALLDPMVINTAGLTTLSLTTAQKAALYRANAPGDVTLNCLTGPSTGGGCTASNPLQSLTVNQVRPLVVTNTLGMTIQAYSNSAQVRDVFLQSSGPLNVSTLNITRNAKILAGQGITATTPAGQLTFKVGGTLFVDGGSGSLGSAAVPITYLTGGILSAARASGDIYLTTQAGVDMRFGQLYADGTMVLRAGGSIVPQYGGQSISAGNLDVEVGVGGLPGNASTIGSATSPLSVRILGHLSGITVTPGTLRAVAPGMVRIDEYAGEAVVTTLTSATGDADLRSQDGSNITVNGPVSSAGVTRLLAGTGNLAFGNAAAVSAGAGVEAGGASLTMASTGAITTGGTANLAAYSGPMTLSKVTASNIYATAFTGAISASGAAGVTNLTATAANGQVGLNQANLSTSGGPYGRGLGTAAQALRINAATVYATTSQGLVNLQLTAANTQAMNIESGNSSVKVDSLGSFSAQRISAGGMGGVLGTVGGPIDLSAAGNISVTTTQAKAPAAAPGAPAATLSASAGGGAYFNAITVPGNVNIQASSATLGSATTQGSLTVRASNYLSAGSLNASGGNISLNAASGALNVGQANALTGAIIASAGPQGGSISSATARDGFALTSLGAWTLGNLVSTSALSDITVTAGNGGIQYNQLTSARDISVASTGGALTTQLGSNATGRNITMAAASAQLGNVSATGTLSIASASGDLIAGTLSSGGADTLSAGRDLSVTSMASASGAVIASASRYFTLGGVTAQSLSITALLDASINALNTTLFASVASTNASATVRSANVGTTANFSAKTLLDIGSAAGTVTATGPMTLTGGSLLRTTGAVSSGNTLSLLANATGGQVQMLTGSTLRSVGTLSVTGSSLTLTDIAATGATSDVLLTANGAGTSGAITFGAISALRNIQLTATGAVTGSGTLSKLIKAGGKVTGSVLSISGAAIEVGAATPGVQNAANTQVSYASGGSLTATGGTLAFTNKTNISNAPAPAPVPAPPAASRR